MRCRSFSITVPHPAATTRAVVALARSGRRVNLSKVYRLVSRALKLEHRAIGSIESALFARPVDRIFKVVRQSTRARSAPES
jgi:hypothetical protein